jgi:hypothetical protein
MKSVLSLLLRRAEFVSAIPSDEALTASIHTLTIATLLGEVRSSRRILSNITSTILQDPLKARPVVCRSQATLLPVHGSTIGRALNVALSTSRESSPERWSQLGSVEKRRVAATVSSEAAPGLISQIVSSPTALEEWMHMLALVPDDVFQLFLESLSNQAIEIHIDALVHRLHQSSGVFTVAWLRNRVDRGKVSRALATAGLFRHGDTMLVTCISGPDCAFAAKMASSEFSPLLVESWCSRVALVCYMVGSKASTTPQEMFAILLVLWDLPRSLSLPLLARTMTSALDRNDLPVPMRGAISTMATTITHSTAY